jgi:hypothetical protein
MRWAAVGLVMLVSLAVAAPPGAAEPRTDEGEIYIATNRVVGFVPFTVYVYGKIPGDAPERIELCRSEISSLMGDSSERDVGRRTAVRSARRGLRPPGRSCAPGKLVPTPDGFDHAYEMRFARAGTYQVRLMMVDRSGRRSVSNTVQVRAF